MELILASASPRREELLKQMGLTFRVIPSNVEEGQPYLPLRDWVLDLATAKAQAIPAADDRVVLAADTVVIKEGTVFGKPRDREEAMAMLRQLSGSVHEVMTGVCVLRHPGAASSERKVYGDVEITKVYFRRLSEREISAYVETGEPLDKAGAYGIQGIGALLVERIEGCYYNVVGLPLVLTRRLLGKCGFSILGGP